MSRHWIIEIADKGPGIVQSHLRKIFQPYFTTKKGRKGLGLCTAKRAVSLHHGSLSIASVQERGTTVTLRLPQQESK
jgi:two-component system, sporulation sensor kinase D